MKIIDMDEYKFEVEPVTKDLLDTLDPFERKIVLEKYHKWIKKVRKEERENQTKNTQRIYQFKNREKINERSRKHYHIKKQQEKNKNE